MTTHAFDTITRRASMLTLGGAGAALAATLADPLLATAKKKRKKSKNKCKKKERRRCNSDIDNCIDTITAVCAPSPTPAECIALLTPCCETCSADGATSCIFAALQS